MGIRRTLFQSSCILMAVFWGFCAMTYAEDPNPASLHSNRGAWPLYRQWNAAEIRHFSEWIENIYHVKTTGTLEQRMAKIEAVLTDPGTNLLLDPEFAGEPCNPQLDRVTMQAMHSILDCGKLTISLGSYYAYRRGLPFMTSYVRSGDGADIRTAAYNIPGGCASSFHYPSAHAFITDAICGFCTGNYRVEPDCERAELSDTVPVAIDPRYLMPGCLYYMDGHVLILGHVDEYGELYFLDSTTAPSRDIYTHNGFNAVTGITPKGAVADRAFGGCYRGFRMFRFPIAETDSDGLVTTVRRMTDDEMRQLGYSLEQYERLQELGDRGQIQERGLKLTSFHDFVRVRLRTANQIDPVKVLQASAERLRNSLLAREAHVQAAWNEVQANGPIEFPEGNRVRNVFNARGRWGDWSSATPDVDLRLAFAHTMNWIRSAAALFEADPEYVSLDSLSRKAVWTRTDLARVLVDEKNSIFRTTTFEYVNSAGESVTLSLADVEARLFSLSFDPNHPPELRWGAQPGSAEAATAPESPTPLPNGKMIAMAEAYQLEAYYRTLSHRDSDESYLAGMFTTGYPKPDPVDAELAAWAKGQPSPPLMPSIGRAAWHKLNGTRG